MGKILQIIVSAWTYREEDLPKTWPYLVNLVWPNPPYPGEKRGVLELVTALENGLAFGEWPQETKTALHKGIFHAVSIKKSLEAALSDWKPKEANTLSDSLEDTFTELEQYVPKP